MPFDLRIRTPDADDLAFVREHEAIAAPRRTVIRWESFRRDDYPAASIEHAAIQWRERARTEYFSLALFTQLASQLHLLGAPLDWAGAFVRMTADEVRHTELSAKMATLLGAPPAAIVSEQLHLPITASTLRSHVRQTIVAAFCIGETLSARMFRQCARAANVDVAKNVVHAIVDDETFHAQFGWEAAALLMRPDGRDRVGADVGRPDVDQHDLGHDAFRQERDELVRSLPMFFAEYQKLSCALQGETWARTEPEVSEGPNFGTLTPSGYARCFFKGMRDDVIPGLVAIGLPEAEPIWNALCEKVR